MAGMCTVADAAGGNRFLTHHSLLQLILEAGKQSRETDPKAFEAVRLVGVAHGITNALRTSIPVMSTTGKLVIPVELTEKHGVRSPRYLLSALGQGDEECLQAMENAVRDMVKCARDHLQSARDLRPAILEEPHGAQSVAALLPGLASETFLNRLERSHFRLTDRNLRNVGTIEHATCSLRLLQGYVRRSY